jgi:hypothetical protein
VGGNEVLGQINNKYQRNQREPNNQIDQSNQIYPISQIDQTDEAVPKLSALLTHFLSQSPILIKRGHSKISL